MNDYTFSFVAENISRKKADFIFKLLVLVVKIIPAIGQADVLVVEDEQDK